MNKDIIVPENIKDPKYREYFEHLHEIIDKQNKEISIKESIISNPKFEFSPRELADLAGELLALLWNDQFNSIRIIIKKHEDQTGELTLFWRNR